MLCVLVMKASVDDQKGCLENSLIQSSVEIFLVSAHANSQKNTGSRPWGFVLRMRASLSFLSHERAE